MELQSRRAMRTSIVGFPPAASRRGQSCPTASVGNVQVSSSAVASQLDRNLTMANPARKATMGTLHRCCLTRVSFIVVHPSGEPSAWVPTTLLSNSAALCRQSGVGASSLEASVFSTSTQPMCRVVSFAPNTVNTILPGATKLRWVLCYTRTRFGLTPTCSNPNTVVPRAQES